MIGVCLHCSKGACKGRTSWLFDFASSMSDVWRKSRLVLIVLSMCDMRIDICIFNIIYIENVCMWTISHVCPWTRGLSRSTGGPWSFLLPSVLSRRSIFATIFADCCLLTVEDCFFQLPKPPSSSLNLWGFRSVVFSELQWYILSLYFLFLIIFLYVPLSTGTIVVDLVGWQHQLFLRRCTVSDRRSVLDSGFLRKAGFL